MRNLQVLIVDDDETIRLLATTLFEACACDVTLAVDGKDGVASLGKMMEGGVHPDLVVVDIMMPELNGRQAAREFQSMGYRGPIVAFTANASLDGKRKAEAAGIQLYLNKLTLRKEVVQALLTQLCGR